MSVAIEQVLLDQYTRDVKLIRLIGSSGVSTVQP